MKPEKLLSRLIEQYRQKHKQLPEKIVIHPIAAVVLSARHSLAPTWNGIPVICEAVKPIHVEKATKLGVIANRGSLQGFDL
jgi:hypothetical protein